VVSHAGVEAVAGDGGNATVHYYYSSGWQILEARNGSNQATRQWVWGTQYVDEPLLMDVNGEPGTNNTCDPDVTDATSIKDRRYYYQQDRNWNVVALFEADDTQGTAGRCVERYAYTPYGEFLVLKGEGASGNLGNALAASTVGNPFTHQGLAFDQEKGSYQDPRSKDTRTVESSRAWRENGLHGLHGYSGCDLTQPPGTPMPIQNDDTTCTRECTQLHEEQHARDIQDCCNLARAAYQAPGADKQQVTRRWNAYLAVNENEFECRAYTLSCQCGTAKALTACCKQDFSCCRDALAYQLESCRGQTGYCSTHHREFPCNFP
jgi:hypothetical protein